MAFEWDAAKRERNLSKHDVDFLRMRQLFDGRPLYTVLSRRNEEDRFVSTGVIDGRYYTIVWVWRGDAIRLISARRSSNDERRTYRALHGGSD